MARLKSLIATVTAILNTVIAQRSSVDVCLDYYKTGNDFELTSMTGRWYPVYFWPANERLRNGCASVDFYQLTPQDVDTQTRNCLDSVPSIDARSGPGVDAGVAASYISNAGRRMDLTFLGSGEFKTLRSGCGKVYRYLFRRIDERNVVGINCSAGGRGVLYSRAVPSAAELAQLLERASFMSGREGGPECRLTR